MTKFQGCDRDCEPLRGDRGQDIQKGPSSSWANYWANYRGNQIHVVTLNALGSSAAKLKKGLPGSAC